MGQTANGSEKGNTSLWNAILGIITHSQGTLFAPSVWQMGSYSTENQSND